MIGQTSSNQQTLSFEKKISVESVQMIFKLAIWNTCYNKMLRKDGRTDGQHENSIPQGVYPPQTKLGGGGYNEEEEQIGGVLDLRSRGCRFESSLTGGTELCS